MTGSKLDVNVETWPIAGSFTISRGAKTEALVVVATVSDGRATGRGECVPYARYGESIEGTVAAIEAMVEPVRQGLTRHDLQTALPPGAARNALDCALWDYEAKASGRSAAELAGLPSLRSVETAYTITLDTPAAMAAKARDAARYSLLKLKLGGPSDLERLAAIREARPDARLIVDANEGWEEDDLVPLFAACAKAGVALVEQPLPAGKDDRLDRIERPIPVCADESLHTSKDLPALAGRYDAVNIKLDKTGGLTEGLATLSEARGMGFLIMVGCMVATSLAMAPALLLAQTADFVDLDGPLLLARDRTPGLVYDGSLIAPPDPALWG